MSNNFTVENLIIGKIAETIFEEMFSEAGDYGVIPFGYEKLVPELANHKKFPNAQRVIDNIRTSPDYAVIMPDKKSVFLIEVKFRRILNKKVIADIVEIAKDQELRWNPSWIFLATLNGFYFARCSSIVKNKFIKKLDEKFVSREIQNKYLKFIIEFEK